MSPLYIFLSLNHSLSHTLFLSLSTSFFSLYPYFIICSGASLRILIHLYRLLPFHFSSYLYNCILVADVTERRIENFCPIKIYPGCFVFPYRDGNGNKMEIIIVTFITQYIIMISSFHIISYHITSYHIISYYIISYLFILYHIISYHIISYLIFSYHIKSSTRVSSTQEYSYFYNNSLINCLICISIPLLIKLFVCTIKFERILLNSKIKVYNILSFSTL